MKKSVISITAIAILFIISGFQSITYGFDDEGWADLIDDIQPEQKDAKVSQSKQKSAKASKYKSNTHSKLIEISAEKAMNLGVDAVKGFADEKGRELFYKYGVPKTGIKKVDDAVSDVMYKALKNAGPGLSFIDIILHFLRLWKLTDAVADFTAEELSTAKDLVDKLSSVNDSQSYIHWCEKSRDAIQVTETDWDKMVIDVKVKWKRRKLNRWSDIVTMAREDLQNELGWSDVMHTAAKENRKEAEKRLEKLRAERQRQILIMQQRSSRNNALLMGIAGAALNYGLSNLDTGTDLSTLSPSGSKSGFKLPSSAAPNSITSSPTIPSSVPTVAIPASVFPDLDKIEPIDALEKIKIYRQNSPLVP